MKYFMFANFKIKHSQEWACLAVPLDVASLEDDI
jgi:hypothetical protein